MLVAAPAQHVVVVADLVVGLPAAGAGGAAHLVPAVVRLVAALLRHDEVLVHLVLPRRDGLHVEQRAVPLLEVLVPLYLLAAAVAEVHAALRARHLVAPLALDHPLRAARALLALLLDVPQRHGVRHHLAVLAARILAHAVVAAGPGRQHRQAPLRRQAGGPRVPPLAAQRAEDVHTLGALPAVVPALVLQHRRLAPRAVHQVSHLVQGPLQRQPLPPRKLVLGEQPTEHGGRDVRPALGLRARQRTHGALPDVDARLLRQTLAAEPVVA
mmetsp:Transcript_16912/g.41554  ORF Transcript_16912/g.41554 Transcript_16912/m.41554 type:complete len:270 (+) Transcript_16912:486-1295(+)